MCFYLDSCSELLIKMPKVKYHAIWCRNIKWIYKQSTQMQFSLNMTNSIILKSKLSYAIWFDPVLVWTKVFNKSSRLRVHQITPCINIFKEDGHKKSEIEDKQLHGERERVKN